MIPTAPCFSKALRRALTPKRGNKDYYKGTRQAYLPGGHRTGAPGAHVIRGKAKYRLIDEKVRVYVAPSIEDIQSSPLKPYVSSQVSVDRSFTRQLYGKYSGGLTPQRYFEVAPRIKVERVEAPHAEATPAVSS